MHQTFQSARQNKNSHSVVARASSDGLLDGAVLGGWVTRNRRDAASHRRRQMIEIGGWVRRRYDFAAHSSATLVAFASRNHPALALFFRTAHANKRPRKRIKRRRAGRGGEAAKSRGKRVAAASSRLAHRMQLFRNGDLVTGRISKREKRGGDRRHRDAGTGYGRNFVSDRFSDRARVPVLFLCVKPRLLLSEIWISTLAPIY